MPVKMQWNGDQIEEAVRRACYAGVLKAAGWLEAEVKKSISQSSRAGSGGARSPVAGGGPPMQFSRSQPGDPPHADTGKLRQSIFMDHSESSLSARVGTTSMVGVYMELGVAGGVAINPTLKKMLVFPGWVGAAASGGGGGGWGWVFARHVVQGPIAPRPFLVPAMEHNQNRLQEIILQTAQQHLHGNAGLLQAANLSIEVHDV
jgi:hypothetical protein